MILYKNASFITCEPKQNKTHTAMAVDEGHIAWIGDEVPEAYAGARAVDLGGAVGNTRFWRRARPF